MLQSSNWILPVLFVSFKYLTYNVQKCLVGGNEEGRARFFWVVCTASVRGIWHKLKHMRSHLNTGKHFFSCEGVKQAGQRGCGIPIGAQLDMVMGTSAADPARAGWTSCSQNIPFNLTPLSVKILNRHVALVRKRIYVTKEQIWCHICVNIVYYK